MKRSLNPFFSVIICTFNRIDMLPAAVDSLISQTEDDWEAIIVDDGSCDGTCEYAIAISSVYDNIRYCHHSNRGVGFSRNIGLRSGLGKFVTFLDSDDRYEKNHLAVRKNILQNSNADLLHGGLRIIGDPFVPDKTDMSKIIHINECVVGGTFFINRKKAIEIGGFPDIRFGDDYEFFNKATANNWFIEKCNDETYIYNRLSQDSLCNKIMFDDVTA